MSRKLWSMLVGAHLAIVPLGAAHADAVQIAPTVQPTVAPQVAPTVAPQIAPQVAPSAQPDVASEANLPFSNWSFEALRTFPNVLPVVRLPLPGTIRTA